MLSMSTSLMAVFIPILLMGGIVGRLFREFAVTSRVAIAVSLVVSLTTTPMMCAQVAEAARPAAPRLVLPLERARVSTGSSRAYDRALSLGAAASALTVLLITLGNDRAQRLPVHHRAQRLLPAAGHRPAHGLDQGDAGHLVRSACSRSCSQFVAASFSGDPAVRTVVAFTGGSGGGSGDRTPAACSFSLKPLSERKAHGRPGDRRIARQDFADSRAQPCSCSPLQDIRVGGRGSDAQYQYTLQGDNFDELNDWAAALMPSMRTLPGIARRQHRSAEHGLQANLVIDRDTASRLGLTPQTIDNALYDAFGQRQVSTMYTPLNQYHVVMEVEPQFRQNPDALNDIYVRSQPGRQVPLSSVRAVSTAPNTSLAVNHQGQFPADHALIQPGAGVALGDAVDAICKSRAEIGMPGTRSRQLSRDRAGLSDLAGNQPMLILAALVTVYIVLGILYESYHPPASRFSRRCLRPASARCSRCSSARPNSASSR